MCEWLGVDIDLNLNPKDFCPKIMECNWNSIFSFYDLK